MALPCGRAWLDLQRYTVTALEHRGATAAAQAVRSALKALLADLPELLDSTLPDDTPVANTETRNWIESSVMKAGDTANASVESCADLTSGLGSSDLSTFDMSAFDLPAEDTPGKFTASDATKEPAGDSAMEWPPLDEHPPILSEVDLGAGPDNRDVFEMAIAVVQGGNTAQGLEMISNKLANERSGRGRFKRRTQLAHLLIASGHGKIAQPMLDELANEIETKRLEEWEESEALAYPLELLLRCVAQENGQGEKRTELYARLCKLDPVRALGFTL